MKNDPHVTEVSDDGALLKRYRNEIVDLKRRLQEVRIVIPACFLQSCDIIRRVTWSQVRCVHFQVSSVTQTTATEKEVLSQLLQEKDQLQREQEDRIRNLTKLIVTSSNLAPVKKVKIPQNKAVLLHILLVLMDHFLFLKMLKRRVTWGGKMLGLARTVCDGSSDLSFAEPFSKKWKQDRSCLSELGGMLKHLAYNRSCRTTFRG